MSDDNQPPAPDAMIPATDARILLSTAPPAKARTVAAALVEERLAACVNLVPGLRSIYRWKASVHDDPETLLIIKTTAERIDALAARLKVLHPHEVPELLALSPEQGLAPYLAWLAASVEAPGA
ncbi:MAG: divalent-cation tolerance protein CutA [Planctomycetota bacterium]|nr:divalent-cation tolerance protein CutA [Planctomycetota bacterium]